MCYATNMKLIVFLGNPGLRYRRTRHNLGWLVGDALARQTSAVWHFQAKFSAYIAELPGVKLVKPQKFYNLTGEVVGALARYYQLAPADILVVCDDLNLPFGTVRFRQSGSDGGNNGLKSISTALGSDDFARLRIGTDSDQRAILGDTYFVIARFSRQQQRQLPQVIAKATERIREFII